DPETLCNYCDEEFPCTPSKELLAMGEKLYRISWSDPLPDNIGHRSIPSMQAAADYCSRHRFERVHVPAAIEGHWPFKPDFSRLFRRILDLGQILRDLCKNSDQSPFFCSARKHYGTKVTQLSSLGAQFASTRSSEHGTRYYGERGYQMLDTTLRSMFPDSLDYSNFHPLTYAIIIREILIPEATIRLIQQDLTVSPGAAIDILQQSHHFGLVLHP
ncbi:hypothetical protein B0H11DRAFT_1692711, partial [Mycena galericulata]